MSFLSSVYPERAGALGSVMFFLCFAGAAVSVSISVDISAAIGVGNFFVILAAVNAAFHLAASILNILRVFVIEPKDLSNAMDREDLSENIQTNYTISEDNIPEDRCPIIELN